MPLLALVAGAAGFFARLIELATAFDKFTGLAQRGDATTYALIAISGALLLVVLFFSIYAARKYKTMPGFDNAFGTDTLIYPVIFVIIGIAWLVSTVIGFFGLEPVEVFKQVDLYFLILSALAAISVALFAVDIYEDPLRRMKVVLSIVPALFMCFWLIMIYRQNAANPVLLSYAYHCLAIIASALGFYFTSGFVYNKPAPGKAIFSYLAAVYFCFVTLADPHAPGMKIVFIALIATNAVHASMLIRNLKWRET